MRVACPNCFAELEVRIQVSHVFECPQCGKAFEPIALEAAASQSTDRVELTLPSKLARAGARSSGIATLLFLMGGAMLAAAFFMNVEIREQEMDDLRRELVISELSGKYQSIETKSKDRTGVYAVAMVGAMFVLGGFIVLSRSPGAAASGT